MSDAKALYLDLLKRALTNLIYQDRGLIEGETRPFDLRRRGEGEDWPEHAHTMIGIKRLDALHFCVEDVLDRGVPGDFIETGVWRGGACIFMRGVLKVRGVTDRIVWLADSFQGLPPPDVARYPQDAGLDFSHRKELAIPLEEVQENFRRYGLLDEQVQFLKGWFHDTLPGAPVERLAVLRLDGDLYQSTMDALTSLYPKLERGGYAIVDDYSIDACRQAVGDYRARHGISEEIVPIDWSGVLWRKESGRTA
ncbi:MAG: TylF/MycF family methyltransferase [Betaproteobacteria bacterium]|nr:TylF/MycF family methyltransferase [Betaproteobacteria bacterium]MDH5349757.1 TylF/MycF family methyltransferase [Betaproteobacteria bacterium]